ncbi:hypothetical protein [Hymenobacter rigui]|uniref:DUF3052 family protein n=1 Tax=Hymenobacter rigui TaxID=334424 RepID=A0A3R9P6K1_9BACT|nr:hypothetical protein [Hymenobacter rigui]RSK45319.1 hypothetical protein EI291_18340 [Hymenobacter rigui]
MNPILKKLNLKEGSTVFVQNFPADLSALRADLQALAVVTETLDQPVEAALVFATTQQQINETAPALATQAPGDATVWFAYPKGSSKKYRCDFNRDTGWAVLGELGFEPVRMVAIDADWTALRFRRVSYVKQLSRSRALSAEGQQRLADSGQ